MLCFWEKYGKYSSWLTGFHGDVSQNTVLLRPALVSENLHLKLRHMDGGSVLNDSESGEFYNFLLSVTPTIPPTSFQSRTACFLKHRILFCWNLCLLPVHFMLIHLRITLSLLKHCLFSPLWRPGSVSTHFVSEWLIRMLLSTLTYKATARQESRVTNVRCQKSVEENRNTWGKILIPNSNNMLEV